MKNVQIKTGQLRLVTNATREYYFPCLTSIVVCICFLDSSKSSSSGHWNFSGHDPKRWPQVCCLEIKVSWSLFRDYGCFREVLFVGQNAIASSFSKKRLPFATKKWRSDNRIEIFSRERKHTARRGRAYLIKKQEEQLHCIDSSAFPPTPAGPWGQKLVEVESKLMLFLSWKLSLPSFSWWKLFRGSNGLKLLEWIRHRQLLTKWI